jgi:hypothetical protein
VYQVGYRVSTLVALILFDGLPLFVWVAASILTRRPFVATLFLRWVFAVQGYSFSRSGIVSRSGIMLSSYPADLTAIALLKTNEGLVNKQVAMQDYSHAETKVKKIFSSSLKIAKAVHTSSSA